MKKGREGKRGLRAVMVGAAAAITLVLIAVPDATATTLLHVDGVHGHDIGNCLINPCKTLGYAVIQGRHIHDLVTIQVAPGTYTEDLALGAADSGLTITGAGSGTNPATSTIITGNAANPTIDATTAADSTSLSLNHLRIVTPPSDPQTAIVGNGTDLAMDDVPIDVQGAGGGISDSDAELNLIKSPIKLQSTASSGPAIGSGGLLVTLDHSPIDVSGTGSGIQTSNAPVSLTSSSVTLHNGAGGGSGISDATADVTLVNSPVRVNSSGGGGGVFTTTGRIDLKSSPVTLTNAGGAGPAVVDSSGVVSVSGSPITVAGTGLGISDSSGPMTVVGSPVKLQNASASGPAISNSSGAVSVSSSPITVAGSGEAVSNSSGPITVSGSPVKLQSTTATVPAITDTSATVSVSSSPITVLSKGEAVINVAGSLTISGSPIRLQNTAGTAPAISATAGAVTVTGSPIVSSGTGGGISTVVGALAVTNSPITLQNASPTGPAISSVVGGMTVTGSAVHVAGQGTAISNVVGPAVIANSPISLISAAGAGTAISNTASGLTVINSPIDMKGTGDAISETAGNVTLSNLSVMLDNPSSTAIGLSVIGRTALSHVTFGGAWKGTAVNSLGSMNVSDSAFRSGGAPTMPLMALFDGGGFGHNVSFQRSIILERSPAIVGLQGTDVNVLVDSSELLGGLGTTLAVTGGSARSSTIASSTVDAGTLGSRNAAPIKSITANADNTSGSVATVNVQGSILVEPPAATRAGVNGASAVNCVRTEVPNTSQAPDPTHGSISCATGVSGNTFTPLLGSIFAAPVTSYRLKPSWSGVDSVPASAISLPFPFTDSATDLLGHPRVLNGRGTCLPGIRDKGAIELTGHSGVKPKPVISGPSKAVVNKLVKFIGKANLPASVHRSFRWHSSDGANGTKQTFSHKFKRRGKFTVSLTVTGAPACVASTSKSVTVRKPAKAAVSAGLAITGLLRPFPAASRPSSHSQGRTPRSTARRP